MRHRQLRSLLRLLTIAVLFALAFVASWLNYAGWTIQEAEPWAFFSRFLTRMGPLLAFFGIAVVILDGLFERQQLRQWKRHLISQLSNRHADVTEAVAAELRSYGWLTDGSLRGASLRRAGLEGVNLRGARLAEARLELANLGGADLRGASLAGAYLSLASLIETDLRGADLRGAECRATNLRGARLEGASLTQIDLRWADLEGAAVTDEQLELAADLNGAVMPDGVRLRDPEGQPALGIDPDPHGPTFADWLADDLPGASAVELDATESAATAPDMASVDERESVDDEPDVAEQEFAGAMDELDSIFAGTDVLADAAEAFPNEGKTESVAESSPPAEAGAAKTGGPVLPAESVAATSVGQMNGEVAPDVERDMPDDRDLSARVREVAQDAGLSYQSIYARLRRDFGVASYRDIADDQLPAAYDLLETLARADMPKADGEDAVDANPDLDVAPDAGAMA